MFFKSKTKPAPKPKVEDEVSDLTIEEVAEEIGNLLHNATLPPTLQVKRQEVLEKYRKFNPTWEPMRHVD